MVELEYVDQSIIRFDDLTFRWADVKRFRWNGRGDDGEVVAALISHWQFRDTYAGKSQEDAKTIHGPYRLERISSASFERISPSAALGVIEEFCSLNGVPPKPEVQKQLHTLVASALEDSACFRLRDLPADAQHDWGWVLSEFRELVVIRRTAGILMLVVMAID